MNKQTNCAGRLPAVFGPLGVLILGAASADLVLAQEPIPYDEAEVFIELNNTDEDLGLHSLIDGEAWYRLVIRGPDGIRILKTRLHNRLKEQGLTEFFFESAEPVFGWLVFCMLGATEMLGFRSIANAAHVGGLLLGCLIAAVLGTWQRSLRG